MPFFVFIVTANFSCVKMNIKLDRVYDFYIIQTYVPTILVVILSWVSFWISIDATPARISLGLLTVLTMTTQNTGLPRVTYFKAIDVWMVSCLIFVFAALIEFAWVNVLSRVAERRRSTIIDIPDHYDRSSQNRQTNHDKVIIMDRPSQNRKTNHDKVIIMDRPSQNMETNHDKVVDLHENRKNNHDQVENKR